MEEIRPIKANEQEEFHRLVRIAFASIPEPERPLMMPEEWTLCMFVDNKIASTYGFWPLKMEFNGNVAPVAGVTLVSSLPVFRRKGYLRKITETHFKMLHEKGEQPISALFASMAAIYQRYGYSIVSSINSYKVEPRVLNYSTEPDIRGDLREAGKKEDRIIIDLYHNFSKGRTGYLHRNEKMEVAEGAPLTILGFPPPIGILNKIIYWEDNKPLGYIIYSINPGPAGQQLMIRDLIWCSISAYNAIWRFLSNMDLVQEIHWPRVPIDDPLPHLLLEPRKLNIMSRDGLLARIIDVDKALHQRKYHEQGKLTFEIAGDDICPWNNGKWKMETSSSGISVSTINEEAQLTMPISTLSMLLFGQISATEAGRMARLDVNDHNALRTWDKVMKTEFRPFCDDCF